MRCGDSQCFFDETDIEQQLNTGLKNCGWQMGLRLIPSAGGGGVQDSAAMTLWADV